MWQLQNWLTEAQPGLPSVASRWWCWVPSGLKNGCHNFRQVGIWRLKKAWWFLPCSSRGKALSRASQFPLDRSGSTVLNQQGIWDYLIKSNKSYILLGAKGGLSRAEERLFLGVVSASRAALWSLRLAFTACSRLLTVLAGPCDPQRRAEWGHVASEVSSWKAVVSPFAPLWITCAHSLCSLALGAALPRGLQDRELQPAASSHLKVLRGRHVSVQRLGLTDKPAAALWEYGRPWARTTQLSCLQIPDALKLDDNWCLLP